MRWVITPCRDITVANKSRWRCSQSIGITSVFAVNDGSVFTRESATGIGNEEKASFMEETIS
jgi:hypothetical protein